MMNKVYEIKRADMLNRKEYTVWKHANEEVWEIDDGKKFAGGDSLVMVERKRVIEFDYNGFHYRVFRKEGDMFGKNESWDYDSFVETVRAAYHRFTEDDFVHITFKDAETDVTPAAILPTGWNWVEDIAGDGYLESPSGKAYFCYNVRDWEKEELTYSENVNGTRVEFYTGFEKFKEYAESKVRGILGKYVFANAALPCNDIEDFEKKDVSMDIPCRIYLKQAPSSRHEKIAKELDGEYYFPDNFFIECIAGRNEPDGDIIISGWMLFYVLETGHIHEFGYVEDVPDDAWDYFKEHIGIGEKQKENIMKRYLVFIKDCYIRDAQALLAGKAGLDDDQSEEGWHDIAAPVLIMDRCFEDPSQLNMLLAQLYPEADLSIFTVYTVDNMEEHGLI